MQIAKKSRYFRRALILVAVLAPVALGAEYSSYRGFELGATLNTELKYSGMDASEVTVLHTRPALIQQLQYRPSRFYDASPAPDPVDQVRLLFVNGRLFRMIAQYDSEKTAGLRKEDMIEGISARFGTATRPDTTMVVSSQYGVDTMRVAARWQQGNDSVSLVQIPYSSNFELVIQNDDLNSQADAAMTEGVRLEAQDAPLRSIVAAENTQSALDKTRAANKANFKP